MLFYNLTFDSYNNMFPTTLLVPIYSQKNFSLEISKEIKDLGKYQY